MSGMRFSELDGLRGVCALSVCVFHFFCMLQPSLAHNMAQDPSPLLLLPIIPAFWNGHLAVWIFFVMSGFVVAASASRRRRWLPVSILARYVRFAIPMTASVCFAWALLTLDPTAATELAAIRPAKWLRYTFQEPIPGFLDAVQDGLVGAFASGSSGFNNVLWTMRIEFVGSCVILLLYAMPDRRLTVVGLVAFAWACFASGERIYMTFAAGALMFEFRAAVGFAPFGRALPRAALAGGLAWGALSSRTPPALGLDLSDVRFFASLGHGRELPMLIPSTLIVFACLALTPVARGLNAPLAQWLGRISFPLYLVHAPILYTLVARPAVETDAPTLLLFLLFLAVSLAVATAFATLIEEPSLSLNRRLVAMLERRLEDRRGRANTVEGS